MSEIHVTLGQHAVVVLEQWRRKRREYSLDQTRTQIVAALLPGVITTVTALLLQQKKTIHLASIN